MLKYHRNVCDAVEKLGVTNVDVVVGGKHGRLVYEYNGKRLSDTISLSPSDPNAIWAAVRSVRHKIGNIPVEKPVTPVENKFNQLPSQPIAPKEPKALPTVQSPPEVVVERSGPTAVGSISHYQSSHCMNFLFPKVIADSIDRNVKYKVIHSDDGWEISPGGNCLIRPSHGDLFIVTPSSRSGLAGDLGFFSRTKAQYAAIDGHVLVELLDRPKNFKRPMKRGKPSDQVHSAMTEPAHSPVVGASAPVEDVLAPVTSADAPSVAGDPNWIVDLLRRQQDLAPRLALKAVLEAVRHMERRTGHRIRRLQDDSLDFYSKIE